MKTVAAIPVKNNIGWTAPLVEHLLLHDKVDEVWVYDNGSTDITRAWIENRQKIDERLFLIDAAGLSVYEMWNAMIARSNDKFNSCNLAILNNDIRIPPFAVRDISAKMREGGFVVAGVDPSRTGLYSFSIGYWDSSRALPEPIVPYCEELKIGDRIGWAFVTAAEFWKNEPYAVHPGYKIWYGDDDLYRRAMHLGGKTCIVRGIGSDHAESQTAYSSDKISAIEEDRKLFDETWRGA